MANEEAGLELPIGLTEQKFLQQLARIEARAIKSSNGMAKQFVQSNAQIGKSFTGMSGQARAGLQNVGFQMQDMIVQIQGGQGAVRALSQQLPQLLGGFGALGAILGTVAAIAVPVGAALFTLGQGSEEAADQAEQFDKALQSAQAALDDFNNTINTKALGSIDALIQKYGVADDAVKALEDRMRAAFKADAFEGFQSAIDDQALGSLLGAESQVARVFGRVQELRTQAADARAELDKLLTFDESVGMQGQFGALRMLQQGEIEDARANMERLNSEVARFGISPDQIATFTQAKDALDQALADQNFTGAVDALNVIQGILRETGDQTLVNVADQLDQVSAQLREGAANAGELPPELAAAADEALALANYLSQAVGAVNSLKGAIADLGVSNVGKQARVAALEAGQSAADASIAGRVAERRADLEGSFSGSDANFTGVQRELSAYEQSLREELKLTEQIDTLEDKLKPARAGRGGGGGRSGGRTPKVDRPFFENIDRDLTNLGRQMTLIGKSNEQIAEARARWELLDEAKRRGIPVNEQLSAQIDAQAAQFGRLTGELERAEASQQQFEQAVDGIADAFAGALVAGESLREGLAQVFKQIASDILSSGIRSAISGQLAGGGGGLNFGSLLGAVKLPSFDGGGFTGFGARSGGIDGKGGMPAIVHPNETIIDHTKGQRTGSASVKLYIEEAPGFAARVRTEAQGVAVQVVRGNSRSQSDKGYLTNGRG